jgi:nicotinamidase-related amidase
VSLVPATMHLFRLNSLTLISLSLYLVHANSVYEYDKRTDTAVVGTGFDANTTVLGDYYNYWIKYPNGTFDLTRSARAGVTSPKILSMAGSRKEIIIEPTRSALVIIDMQNFFLYPKLSPGATKGRAIVNATVNMIEGFRAANMKILWTFWGLDSYDLLTIPPSFKSGFSTNGSDLADQSFGADMGIVDGIPAGRKLMRGSWNAQPYGVLNDLKNGGLAAGTDLYFNKNRLSGLWGAQTPLGLWLQENEITTLFFGGVNADQCVWSTFIDAYFKG